MPGPNDNKSPAAAKKSDDATGKAFCGASTGISEECIQPEPAKPCDIVDVKLESIAFDRKKTYKVLSYLRVQPVAPEKKSRAISWCGILHDQKKTELEVVGDISSAGAATKIKAHFSVLAAHDASHVKVTVSSPKEKDVVLHYQADGSYEFPVYRTTLVEAGASSLSAMGIFERIFTLHLEPAVYKVTVESCGIRFKGTPVGSAQMTVLVYPLDQYFVKLQIPSLVKASYTKQKQTNFVTGTETISSEGSLKSTLGQGKYDSSYKAEAKVDKGGRSELTAEQTGGGVKGEYSKKPDEAGKYIETSSAKKEPPSPDGLEIVLMKNDQELEATANLRKIIKLLKDVNERIELIRGLIKYFVPQIGFKFDFSASFLEGAISIGCGWKEHTDNTVYFGVSADITIWIFKITLSASFGVQVGPAALRVVLEISNAGVKLQASWEVRGPKDPTVPPTAKAVGLIPIEARGEAVFDITFITYKAIAGIRTGFEVEGGPKLNKNHEFEMETSIKFTGVQAFILTQDPDEGVIETVYQLADEQPICEGTEKL